MMSHVAERERARFCGAVIAFMCPTLLMGAGAAFGEPLDRRFGPEQERGYRTEREYDGSGRDFRNLDRANFLGARRSTDSEPETPRPDLQHPPAIGKQK